MQCLRRVRMMQFHMSSQVFGFFETDATEGAIRICTLNTVAVIVDLMIVPKLWSSKAVRRSNTVIKPAWESRILVFLLEIDYFLITEPINGSASQEKVDYIAVLRRKSVEERWIFISSNCV